MGFIKDLLKEEVISMLSTDSNRDVIEKVYQSVKNTFIPIKYVQGSSGRKFEISFDENKYKPIYTLDGYISFYNRKKYLPFAVDESTRMDMMILKLNELIKNAHKALNTLSIYGFSESSFYILQNVTNEYDFRLIEKSIYNNLFGRPRLNIIDLDKKYTFKEKVRPIK
jgi:hypothetical protein